MNKDICTLNLSNINTNNENVTCAVPQYIVLNDGIYIPDRCGLRMIMSKEIFIEAYNKFIGGKK